MKVTTSITIDPELLKQAQEKLINVSGLTEAAIREKLGKKEVTMSEAEKCEFCGIEGEQETTETVNQSSRGLTWLFPDEKWICNSCLKTLGRQVLK